MEKLLYRGNKYTQHKEIVSKNSVQLKYRRSIYNQKRQLISKIQNNLIYRGSKYLSKGSTNKHYRPEANQKVFSLVRELINAQFHLANDELTSKLWNEIAAHKLIHNVLSILCIDAVQM